MSYDFTSMPLTQAAESLHEWLLENMSAAFHEQVSPHECRLIASALLSLSWQGGFATLESPSQAFCICLNEEGADLQVLERFIPYEIRDYRSFVSTAHITPLGYDKRLRIIALNFLEDENSSQAHTNHQIQAQAQTLLERYPNLPSSQVSELLGRINPQFLKLLNDKTLPLALELLVKPLIDEFHQVQILPDPHWQTSQRPSLHIAISVALLPLNSYLHRLAKILQRKGLFLRRINATHVAPFSPDGRLLIVLAVHGASGLAAWDVTSIPELQHELGMVSFGSPSNLIDEQLVDTHYIQFHEAHWVRAAALFCHQMLASFESDIYTYKSCEEALLRHPQVTQQLVNLFECRSHPQKHAANYCEKAQAVRLAINKLDTGQVLIDKRRQHILNLALDWIDCTLKTNFWRSHKLGICYRIDPQILQRLPFPYSSKFPEMPYALFFHYGQGTFGFHVRFRDLARGGLRTVLPRDFEQYRSEQNGLFFEAYQLALTQQKKNKDIPEGGAKAVLLCTPHAISLSEKKSLSSSLFAQGFDEVAIQKRMGQLETQRQESYVHQSQKAFVESLLILINTDDRGSLKARHIVDYWKKPEYLFLGPDENLSNEMVVWIEQFSRKHAYRSGGAFISSHPTYGFNHKQYGVTSLGVHAYLKEALKFLGIDPLKSDFSLKLSGGPDGDVAGNQILLLANEFPKTAHLLALTDVSGTIYDPQGLNFEVLKELFQQEKPICFYPSNKLHEGSFLLDRTQHQNDDEMGQKTLLWRGGINEAQAHWITASEANLLFRQNIHRTQTDVFIPAGGRPRTLDLSNLSEFLQEGKPTCRIIVEGANLYITQEAREALEKLGVIIFRDSSANKGGVMSSSMEVLLRLILEPQELLEHKPSLVEAILQTIQAKSQAEAQLLLREHQLSGKPLTFLSQEISERINLYSDQLREALEAHNFTSSGDDPLNQILIHYAPPYIREHYSQRLLTRLPDNYKRAIIATHLACQLVYKRGLGWSPTLASTLPILLYDPALISPFQLTE